MIAAAAGLPMPRPAAQAREKDDDLNHGFSPQQKGKRYQSCQTAGEDKQLSSAPVGLSAKIDIRDGSAASINQVNQSHVREWRGQALLA